MEETPKESAEQLLKEDVKETETSTHKAPENNNRSEGVDVLEIFPFSIPKPKFLVQGNVTLKIHSIGLEVRNVPYMIDKNHKLKVQAPFRYHRFPNEPEKPDVYVESIKFDDGNIWKEAIKVVKAAVLEHHRKELQKTEDQPEN